MPPIRTVVLDLDDTLIETGEMFRRALDCLCATVRSQRGADAPPDAEILRRQEEIDIALLMKDEGIRPERFAESLAAAGREFVENLNAADEATLYEAGIRAFRDIPRISDDTIHTLEALGDREKILYTWGHDDVQRPKVEAHGLETYFTEIHCVKAKSADTLAEIIAPRNHHETLVCGDSLKAEIAPAVALGCHAVLLHRSDAWVFHKADVAGPYHKIHRLSELIPLINEIESLKADG